MCQWCALISSMQFVWSNLFDLPNLKHVVTRPDQCINRFLPVFKSSSIICMRPCFFTHFESWSSPKYLITSSAKQNYKCTQLVSIRLDWIKQTSESMSDHPVCIYSQPASWAFSILLVATTIWSTRSANPKLPYKKSVAQQFWRFESKQSVV